MTKDKAIENAIQILLHTDNADKDHRWITTEPYDVQVAIGVMKDGTMIILFEGSKSGIDWKVNFNFFMKPYRNMKALWFAHRGFTKAFKTVRKQIRNSVFVRNPKKILIGGFSQGSAYTVLCHEDLMFANPNISIESVGIGGPRVVAFWPFGKKLRARMKGLALVHLKKDPVPRLPFALLGFKHRAERIVRLDKFGLPRVKVHSRDYYMEVLKKELEAS
jgi:hypothetical protein